MADISSTPDLRKKLSDIKIHHSHDEAVALIEAMLKEEYARLEPAIKTEREAYLKMNVDDAAQQNDIADLRLAAVEAYQPSYVIENFLTGMGVDILPLLPEYEGRFEVSARNGEGWIMSVASLNENAMRTLGGHCNVVGDVIVLERLLYDHTYLAAVMKLTDDYEPGKQSYVEFDFYTVVFDEEVQALVKVPLDSK
ncbi:MAG TPA: hypothetical protein VMC84_07160 [Methanocella sp.]|uniref:hypothetical protein n=1 Tax=Methanocella sp. TaxID=2052833 RepID=UPI002C40DAFB|nr:hypothetical protein [Methanocella sp.]HTY90942.1 hypothetical protein [Methanocella sp.]